MTKVRRATLLDVKELEELSYEYWEEYKHLSHSLSYHKDICTSGLCDIILADGNLILVAEDKGRLVGYLWLAIFNPYYSSEYYLNEQYMYITKSYRGSMVFGKLIKAALTVSKETGCDFLQVGEVADGTLSKVLSKRFTKIGEVYKIKVE